MWRPTFLTNSVYLTMCGSKVAEQCYTSSENNIWNVFNISLSPPPASNVVARICWISSIWSFCHALRYGEQYECCSLKIKRLLTNGAKHNALKIDTWNNQLPIFRSRIARFIINIGKNKNGYRDRTHGFAKKYDIHVLKVNEQKCQVANLVCQ